MVIIVLMWEEIYVTDLIQSKMLKRRSPFGSLMEFVNGTRIPRVGFMKRFKLNFKNMLFIPQPSNN